MLVETEAGEGRGKGVLGPAYAGDGLTAVRYTFWRNIDFSVGKRGV